MGSAVLGFVTVILVLAVQPLSAQTDKSVWDIKQQCIGKPTKPPKDWTFSGTLLLTSFGKLHAYRQEWETPRILLFKDADFASALSPDGHWYAYVESVRSSEGLYVVWTTRAIHVYSTLDNKHYTMKWENTFAALHTLTGHGLYWLDNQHLLYSRGDGSEETWYVIDPFSGEITDWQGKFTPSWDYFIFSPDRSKALYTYVMSRYGYLYNGEKEIKVPLYVLSGIWKPDSSGFAAYTATQNDKDEYRPVQFALFKLNGEITDILFDVPQGASVGLDLDQGWSPDGRYLVFEVDEHLFIADIQEKLVIDPCVMADYDETAAWSPTANQFALVAPYSSKREIQVFDLQRWQRYVVGYHRGEIIGWRAD